MKFKIILLAASMVCFGDQVWGQSKPASTTQVTPIVHHLVSNQVSRAGSNIHSVNIVLRQQMRQIQKDRKSGKLTEVQAKAAWENLKSLRRQELEYFKQNGEKEITSEQKSELTSALSQNAGSI